MARRTEAETSLEVILTLSGEVCSAEPDVGIMGAYVEDACVDSATVDVWTRDTATGKPENGHMVQKTHDLLAGLDPSKVRMVMTPEWWVMLDVESGREVARRKPPPRGNSVFNTAAAVAWGMNVAKAIVLGNIHAALGDDTMSELLLEGVDDEPAWEDERDEP